MKFSRSERLVDMTNYLLAHPGDLFRSPFLLKDINRQSPRLVKI